MTAKQIEISIQWAENPDFAIDGKEQKTVFQRAGLESSEKVEC